MVHGGTSDDDNAHTIADNADNTYYYYPSIGDVLKTRAILHQLANCNGVGIPIELVDMIIDEAEYWPSILTEMPRSISIMKDNDRQCLLTPPLCYDLVGSDSSFPSSSPKLLPHRSPHPCCKIVFTIQSHDQGWGGEPGSTGSYWGSYTWFDAYILPQGYRSNGDGNASQDEAPIAPERPFIPTATRLQKNRAAVRETQRYNITWHYLDSIDQHSEEAERIDREEGRGSAMLDGSNVRSMKLGDTVSVWARARFPGWINHVKSISVRVFWAI
ncbi:hypothetical protein Egran_03283 [Elaphomyces granulatus]|uniref:Uncharacterized protein n=1 Tax=Elaphomyces granulatus TaxID=519963 RepID=A0A232LXR2_9EURO|nr:hypothetical protein Egran_03283 [Elaphomyces granulatus]